MLAGWTNQPVVSQMITRAIQKVSCWGRGGGGRLENWANISDTYLMKRRVRHRWGHRIVARVESCDSDE